MLLEFAAVIAISYLVGSIPSGYIAGRALKGIDVREYGSGVTGATNVMRTLGKWPFIGVLVADALKGSAPGMAPCVGLFVVLTFRYMSLMSIVTVPLGALAFLILAVAGVRNFLGVDEYTYTQAIFGAFATALVLLLHTGNIGRLIQGTEPKLGEGDDRRKRRVPDG